MTALTQTNALREFWFRLSKSQFFVASLLFHLLLVIFFGGKAIFDNIKEDPDMIATEAGQFVSSDPNPAPPAPPAQPAQTKPQFNVTPTQAAAPAALSAITSMSNSPTSFNMPMSMVTAPTRANNISVIDTTPVTMPSTTNPATMNKETQAAIAGFTGGWAQSSGGGGGSLKSRKFKFTAYVAKYAGGDWASTVRKNGDRIVGGSLPNLLYLMKTQSQDKIDATPDPEAIDLSSNKIFAVKPPFIFFTGHRDFVLTPLEVENLQRYVRLGGCIWGDSSLPGQRSRFDIAFRREMKRVIPDIDKQFEALPADHEIFTKTYFNEIRGVPPGINNYHEPVYALKYNGEIGVLYTANDYGDMWQVGLDARWQVDSRRGKSGEFVALNQGIWENRDIYYRGITPEKVANTFKFGTNVVIHLLTRWESKVRSIGTL